ncbi:MAG: glycine cleavage system protein H [Candidatus Heimdallarchaeota archaeon]
MVTFQDMEFPEDRLYHKEHSWAKEEGGLITVGLDSFTGKAAGTIAHIRIFNPGKEITIGKSVGTIETGKWVGPIRTPVSGIIIEVNEAVKEKPDTLNTDPYENGWIFKVKPTNWEREKAELMKTSDKIVTWISEEYELYKDQFPQE